MAKLTNGQKIGIGGAGVGLAAIIAGIVMFFTTKSPATDAIEGPAEGSAPDADYTEVSSGAEE